MGNEPEGEEKREAIVLRLSPTKDNDAMVTALCSGSLFSFFARGIRKPGSKSFSSCQPLSRSSFRLKRSKQGNYSLLEGESLEVMTKFGDLDAMVVSSLLSEAAEKVLSEDSSKQECHDAYLGLLDSLRQIKLGADAYFQGARFLSTAISMCGIEPEVDRCVRCGSKKSIVGISGEDGGFVCRDCLRDGDDRFGVPQLREFRLVFLGSKLPTLEPSGEKALLIYLSDYLSRRMGIRLKNTEVLRKI